MRFCILHKWSQIDKAKNSHHRWTLLSLSGWRSMQIVNHLRQIRMTGKNMSLKMVMSDRIRSKFKLRLTGNCSLCATKRFLKPTRATFSVKLWVRMQSSPVGKPTSWPICSAKRKSPPYRTIKQVEGNPEVSLSVCKKTLAEVPS